MAAASFVDRVVLHVAAGHGGHGVASVKREKFKPLGGPDGGNGGSGGSVILRVDPQATTLLDYHHRPHQSAGNGKPGAGDERNGADGVDLVLAGPPGHRRQGRDRTRRRPTSSPRARSTSSPAAAAAGWATRRSRHRAAGRPGSPCWASRGRPGTSSSS